MKLCINCKHYEPPIPIPECMLALEEWAEGCSMVKSRSRHPPPLCVHPRTVEMSTNPVDGLRNTEIMSCYWQRRIVRPRTTDPMVDAASMQTCCDQLGAWWEAKPDGQ